MAKQAHSLSDYLPRVLLLGVYAPYNKTADLESYFQEFRNLAKTNGIVHHEELYVKLRNVDPTYFFTEGKLLEIKEFCEAHNIDQVVISEALSPMQERNLRDMLHRKLFDRTKLILEIFEKAAHSAEGKTQVAIAILEHDKTRLAGKGISMSQQAGGIGQHGGPGETAKEKERRHIEDSIAKLRKQLITIAKARMTQRKQRLESGLKQACLIGYTNAGKSTILNALTKSKTLAEDKLFCTLDTTTRELYINSKKKGLLSDTVGFIQQLPHQLIEAFKSTLSELEYSDLLIHVVDVADPNWESHIKVVNNIVTELHMEHKPMVYVFNKMDAARDLDENRLERYQPHVVISARSKEGLAQLIDYLDAWQ
jgi:GTPase